MKTGHNSHNSKPEPSETIETISNFVQSKLTESELRQQLKATNKEVLTNNKLKW